MKLRIVTVFAFVSILVFGTTLGYAVATDLSRTDAPIGSVSFTRHVEHESIAAVSGITTRAMEIACPSGAKAIGGGGVIEDANDLVMPLYGSAPMADSNWVVYFNHAGFTSPFDGQIYVNCLSTS